MLTALHQYRSQQRAALTHSAEVVIGIAKGILDHGEPLEIVPNLGFQGHTDAAMQLDRLLADKFSTPSYLNFAAAIDVDRSAGSSKLMAMVANSDIERACSSATNMSAARC